MSVDKCYTIAKWTDDPFPFGTGSLRKLGSLVSCFCHRFYSLSWYFSQGFISHCLFQLLKFLSPACWGFGCIQEMIRILRTAGGGLRSPSPFLFGDSGDGRVLSFLGRPACCCWSQTELGVLIRLPQA